MSEWSFKEGNYNEVSRSSQSSLGERHERQVRMERNMREERRERHGRRGEVQRREEQLDMSKMMRDRFVPPSYTRDLHNKLQRLSQGSKSVEEYCKEIKMDLMMAQIRESDKATMARFLHSLNREIQDGKEKEKERVRREKSLKKERVRREKSLKKEKVAIIPTPNALRTSNIKCFKCLSKCHIALQCPNKRFMILRDNREVESESSHGEKSSSTEIETSNDDSHYKGDLLMVRRLMSSQINDEVETQRKNIFHSWCLVLGNLCSMVINGWSCVNVASQRLVKKLVLSTFAHPRPYKLQWLSEKGVLLVDKQIEVVFTLGSYEDEVVYNVVLMEATHLLLGRLWQFDKVIHNRVTNRFTFIHMGQKIVLKLLSPREVNEDQNKMRVKREKMGAKWKNKRGRVKRKERKEKGKRKDAKRVNLTKSKVSPHGLYTPLPIPTTPWIDISIYFVLCLPKSKGGRRFYFCGG
ncbi:hypothetical protein CR513_31372, partial [Mucuna pruriens]